jgi:hypothetical protein
MVGNELTSPSNGGGFRIMFDGLTVNYYTGKYNGCYKTMWFRFGEWCSAQQQFWYEPGEAGCGNFTEGRAPDDGWFEGDLYQVGGNNATNTTDPSPALAPAPSPAAAPEPAPARPVSAAPVRVGPTDRPAPTAAPVRVEPTDRPATATDAPVRVEPTDRPIAVTTPPTEAPTDRPVTPPTDEPTAQLTPTQEPTSTLVPTVVPISTAVATAPPSPQPVTPTFCHFRYCRRNRHN